MTKRSGFTIIELLVVIAIIGILAAITVPVFTQVKVSGYRSGDISNMNSIRSAILLYKTDQGGVPPALLGYISPYQYVQGETVVPANQYFGALYPKRIDSLETLRPALNRSRPELVVPAAWPSADPRPLGDAPIVDTNSDGRIDAADDIADARQAFSSNYPGGQIRYYRNGTGANPGAGIGAENADNTTTVGRFYAISGYDVQRTRTVMGDVNELRYTPFWTTFGIGAGSGLDDPRQLGYSEPPETTVITWNSSFREYDANSAVKSVRRDIVLFLGGSARPFDSRLVADRSWRVLP